MEVSFNGAEGATVELMRRWLNSLDQSGDLGLVPLHTYGILCKSKDNTLFPLLCCNAGALPDGMEIRDEEGTSIRNAVYTSPVLSAAVPNGERYACERVSDLPDYVKQSLENVCQFFHPKYEPLRIQLNSWYHSSDYAQSDDFAHMCRQVENLLENLDNQENPFYFLAQSANQANDSLSQFIFDSKGRAEEIFTSELQKMQKTLENLPAPGLLDLEKFEKHLKELTPFHEMQGIGSFYETAESELKTLQSSGRLLALSCSF